MVFLFLGLHISSYAQNNSSTFTLYLVRHAEKELSSENPKDPPLTPCGEQRAASLEVFLSAVPIEAVYSSDYTRTRDTAKPLAEKRKLTTQIYNPKSPQETAAMLLARRQNALVVGHSNSTPELVGALIGEKLQEMDESIYNRIYQVVFYEENGKLNLLHSNFVCQE